MSVFAHGRVFEEMSAGVSAYRDTNETNVFGDDAFDEEAALGLLLDQQLDVVVVQADVPFAMSAGSNFGNGYRK